MKRIIPLSLIFMMLALGAGPARGQQPPEVPRIGLLVSGSPTPGHLRNRAALLSGLRELGYIEGKNIFIEYRYANGKRNLLPELAAELVRLKVAVIVPSGPTAIRHAMKATKTIPIVMPNGGSKPVKAGFVKSLGRPGGNATGVAREIEGVKAKRMELLKEALPSVSRVAVLNVRRRKGFLEEYKQVARVLGVDVESVEFSSNEEFEEALARIATMQPDALIIVRTTITLRHASKIARFALKNRIPSMNDNRYFVEVGGLMSYGADYLAMWRRAAVYVDKILKGANPATLPVERSQLEIVINLKTARKLGVTIPPEILLEANEIIK